MNNKRRYKYVLPAGCPKCIEDRKIKNGIEIYRICKSYEFDENDFVPLFFSKNARDTNRIKSFNGNLEKICQSAGLSIHTDKEEIIKKMKKMPMLGKYIFYAKINEEGEIYDTSSKKWPTHMTFYVYENFKERDFFERLHEEKNEKI